MAGNNEIKNGCVSFNLADKWQKEAWDFSHSQTTNFSAYIKRLIQRDMESTKDKQPEKLIEVVDESSYGNFFLKD